MSTIWTVRILPNKTVKGTDRETKETTSPPLKQPAEEDPISSSDRQLHKSDFEIWWEVIPRRHRQAKIACRDEYVRARRRGADPAMLISRISEYFVSHQGRSEFANHPRSWLASGKYDDPAEAWKSADNKAAKARNEKLADHEPRPSNIGNAAL